MKPDLDAFDAMVRTAYAKLPSPFRELTGDVMIRVRDWPEPEVLDELGIAEADGLLGLYEGVDLTQKSLFDGGGGGDLPDRVSLYRVPILRFWMTGPDDLESIIEHVLIHEIGHHFGLSDDDMEGLEDEAYAEETAGG